MEESLNNRINSAQNISINFNVNVNNRRENRFSTAQYKRGNCTFTKLFFTPSIIYNFLAATINLDEIQSNRSEIENNGGNLFEVREIKSISSGRVTSNESPNHPSNRMNTPHDQSMDQLKPSEREKIDRFSKGLKNYGDRSR